MNRNLVLGSTRELGTVALVAGMCGAYAAMLVMLSTVLGTSSAASGTSGFGAVLGVVSTVFVLIALYVSAVVVVNAVDTVLAGRLGRIALLRLLGARGRSLRGAVMRGTGAVAASGALAGVAAGTAGAWAFRVVLVEHHVIRRLDYPVVSPWLLAPLASIVLMSLAAGWVGSRSVLRVSPAAVLAGQIADEPRRTSRRRTAVAVTLILGGAGALVLAAVLGESGDLGGFVLAFLGSATSATGLLVGARLVIPRAVAAVGHAWGGAPVARIARRNAVKDPRRTTRSTMGLVIGVTLVTTFASGLQALRLSVDSWQLSATRRDEAVSVLSTMTTILVVVAVVSAVISAVGFVSTMSMTVIQREREIGLLRTLGFTRHQVRTMIAQESAALSGSAVLLGVVLGLVYGSVGAQALIGSQTSGFVWGVPWRVLAAIAVGAVALVLVAALPPARRAVRVTPIEALRIW